MTTLYHGSTLVVEHPRCDHGRADLDFGQGFYLTPLHPQAEAWARRVATYNGGKPVLNIYQFDREAYMREGRCLVFPKHDRKWFDFVVANRRNQAEGHGYDYIEGGIANDQVIDTINLYLRGFFSKRSALHRLAMHQPNLQICLCNQTLLDKYLTFHEAIQL